MNACCVLENSFKIKKPSSIDEGFKLFEKKEEY